ncbi:MAG: hypothetical protein QM800_05135 [Paludibacter sp.]
MNRGTITIRNTNSDNIQVCLELSEDGTVWMTKDEISYLFNIYHSTLQSNIKAIFKSDKLLENVGKKEEYYFLDNKQQCVAEYFNLDVIIALCYRIDNYVCILFRQWVTEQVITSLRNSSLTTDRLGMKANLN